MLAVIVVIGILSTHAYPKYFAVSLEAQTIADDKAAENISFRFGQKVTGNTASNPSDPWPTMADIVGYVAPSTPPPVTAPLTLDYSFRFESVYFVVDRNLTSTMFNNIDQVTCDQTLIDTNLKPAFYYTAQSGAASRGITSVTVQRISGTENSAAIGAPVPKCRGSHRYFTSASSTPYSVSAWNSAVANMTASPGSYYSWKDSSFVYTLWGPADDLALSNSSGYGWTRDLPAKYFRLTCAGHTASYGMPYVISGAAGTYASSNGLEKSPFWYTVSWTTPTRISSSPIIDSSDGVIPTIAGTPVCSRVGTPVSVPAQAGVYPMASDGSGYCVRTGWKVQTWKDEAGLVPTTAWSDKVRVVGKKAVADAVNCPASLF